MKYRVWTKDNGGKLTVHTGWLTKGQCIKHIIGRWGHWPAWTYISQAKNSDTFIKRNGLWP